jgi:hypothetical protein
MEKRISIYDLVIQLFKSKNIKMHLYLFLQSNKLKKQT